MINPLVTIKTNAWRTSSARYNAARRLRRRELFATISLALMSALTVAMAFLQRVYATGAPADNYITVISGALGVFLLTVSLVEWGAKTGTIAEALHQNAEKLNGFWRRVNIRIEAAGSVVPTLESVESIYREYEGVKAECQHNHLPIDDEFFRSHHLYASEFLNGQAGPTMGKWAVLRIYLKWQLASTWYITIIWLVLIAMLAPLANKEMWRPAPLMTINCQYDAQGRLIAQPNGKVSSSDNVTPSKPTIVMTCQQQGSAP